MRSWVYRRRGALLVAVLVVTYTVSQAQTVEPQSAIYSCVDAKGRKLTSDRLIPECMDREQLVLNPSGTVRARLAPTLTAQERAEFEAKAKRETEARSLKLDEQRRERALLIRYPSKEVHDAERVAALAQTGVATQAANKRIGDLLQDRRKLDAEMEFYKKDPAKAPQLLRRQIDDIEHDIAVQKRFIRQQEIEARRINTRFDQELVRLKQLWLAQARSTPVARNEKKAP